MLLEHGLEDIQHQGMATLHEIADAVLRPVRRYLVMSLGHSMLQHLLLEQRVSANNASRQSLRREGSAEPKELERRHAVEK
jgi:hypothetical protein